MQTVLPLGQAIVLDPRGQKGGSRILTAEMSAEVGAGVDGVLGFPEAGVSVSPEVCPSPVPAVELWSSIDAEGCYMSGVTNVATSSH